MAFSIHQSALGTEGGGPEGESIVGKVAHTMGKGFSALKEGVAGAAAKVGNAAMGGQRGEESMAEAMKHAVEFGVKGVKETVAGMAEKISKTTAAREESMQAAAGRERKRRAHGEKGAEEAEVAAEKAGAGGDVRNVDTGDGRRGVPEQEGEEEGKGKGEGHPSDSVLGAPPGPKTEEEAGGQPWGRGSW